MLRSSKDSVDSDNTEIEEQVKLDNNDEVPDQEFLCEHDKTNIEMLDNMMCYNELVITFWNLRRVIPLTISFDGRYSYFYS